MTRIMVTPEELRDVGGRFERTIDELRRLSSHTRSALRSVPWEAASRAHVEERCEEAYQLSGRVTEEGQALARFLLQKATQFEAVDLAPLPTTAGAAAGPVTSGPAPTADPTEPHVKAMLEQTFSKPEDYQIIRHTMDAEGPGRFGASWGGVVYKDGKTGVLKADRQMLNFGLISFAFPSGSAGGVMRRLLTTPQEEAALRAIALRQLEESPGGTIPEGWRDLLRTTEDPTYPPRTREQLVDEFIAGIKSGNDRQTADWLCKYASKPTTEAGVNSTDLREDWQGVFKEWLSRPASQAAQLAVAKEQYFDGSDGIAAKLGLHSVKGVAFVFDTRVQSGSIPDSLWAKAATPEYRVASEPVKLEMLRDCFAPGSTEWQRRDRVLQDGNLSDGLYPR